ncbi:non-hydrolyzing UDP-N-acetylglucosamine 2-epimerase [Ectothiorhodospira shaposhnikovii]|uniref:non-hydrolyzing UDP-N-acetylglucosamine 2-epimerase n=1 Tax=Ectothiorhodospira shaposhnikovii TaxID=1054 RepID=UPI001EE8FE08|nr:UDP-N-acetylglucosamine 2-epimerase (non-hydrolyzing) [Ectothiorhodospira shaposhnikovii]MCG5512070.1 UDP-N-acetylglucosamine 2-epimerase (non-hydrolyzing) [Ectothiorhodospira shaposhnikovii]
MSSIRPILCVVGARPNFMKIAPIMRAFAAAEIPALLLHTGQHYDADMNDAFFRDLGIPHPDINLEVGSGTHAQQTAEIMRRVEPVLDQHQPAAILVVGDVNSTIACALVAAKKGVPVIHVEAGLRSRDRTMPEEINRVLTDQISDLLFTTERSALDNLKQESIDPERVHFVGNVMIDTLHYNLRQAIPASDTLKAQGLDAGLIDSPAGYALLTLHRPSNVDDRTVLTGITDCINRIARDLPIIFPIHPRTRGRLMEFGLLDTLAPRRVLCTPPLGYLQLLGLMREARLVLTDSGGIQEETTALGIPCITLRHNTERPITVTEGTNTLVGNQPEAIMGAVTQALAQPAKSGRIPEYWDGKAAERIAAVLKGWSPDRT